jgi:hypothetical protein
LKGQWIGRFKGDREGQIIVNIDDIGKNFTGVAFTLQDDKKIPSSAGFFQTKNKRAKNTVKAITVPIDPRSGLPSSWEIIKKNIPRRLSFFRSRRKIPFQKRQAPFKSKDRFRY